MSEPIISIRIPRAEVRDNPTRHVVYQITITGPVRAWTVFRRYSEFESLNSSWLTLFPHAPPPFPLPPKTIISIFGFTTSSDPAKIEERRRSLEQYLMAVLESRDDRWRKSKEWADFMALPDTARRALGPDVKFGFGSNGSLDGRSMPPPTQESWMDDYRQLQGLCREIRAVAASRDRFSMSGDIVASQSAGIQGRKMLATLQGSIATLKEQLKESDAALEKEKVSNTSGPARVTLTKGEIDRRFDLILNLQTENDRLVKLFASSASSSSSLTSNNGRISSSTISATQAFTGASSPSAATPTASRSGRKFGKPQETEITRNLDNRGLLHLQTQTMSEQDEALEALSKIVKRQQEIGLAIGQELDLQNEMLEDLDNSVTKVGDNLKISSKKLDTVMGKKK
ncbi:hypothetical protein HDU97_006381 [Phlyctochytrium planicorne]|nr:hypothetical protein HDU97_006381 [Phlyctochytrium planicorne]